jgi:hypothetical protein
MPANVVKSYAEKAGVSTEEAEKKWAEAKSKVDESGPKKDSVAYWKDVTFIFKKMMKISD